MRYYLTSRPENYEALLIIEDYLTAKGWIDVSEYYHDVQQFEGIKKCDLFIVLLPCDAASWIEMGAALAVSKPVMILSPNYNLLDETPFRQNSNIAEQLIDEDIIILAFQAYKRGRKIKNKKEKKHGENSTSWL